MWPLKLLPQQTTINFVRFRMVALFLSTILIIVAIGLFLVQGVNYGIDFTGGTLIEIETPQSADIYALRKKLNTLDMGEVTIQHFGSPKNILIRVGSDNDSTDGSNSASVIKTIKSKLGNDVIYRRTEVIGAQVSEELIKSGMIAITVAIGMMLTYIWLRFEWQFSLGSIVALLHDIILTIGMFALLQLEFNLSIIAAILAILGYSMNDTVVVYDRIRENLRKYRTMSLLELFNVSINETLSRTIMTSVTTLIALFFLYTLGGEVMRGFTFTMIWGVCIGTYSSIFIAGPLLLYLGVKRDWSG